MLDIYIHMYNIYIIVVLNKTLKTQTVCSDRYVVPSVSVSVCIVATIEINWCQLVPCHC